VSYRVLAVGNNKGGIGKTFISKSLAEYAAMVRKMRVLLIDLDPQTNLSRRFLDMDVLDDGSNDYAPPRHPDFNDTDSADDDDWDGFSDAADIWLKGFAIPYPTRYENLEIIPSHSHKLQNIELVKRQDVHEEVVRWLKKFLFLDEVKSDYDLVIIDTRPSKGPLVQAAMHASTHLLIPSEMEAPSVEGLHGMLSVRTMTNLQRAKADQLQLVGILANKVKAGVKIHEEFLNMLGNDPQIGGSVLPLAINDWVGYKESMLFGAESIFERPPSDKLRKQLMAVGELIFTRMGIDHG
jgi:chromosome partitioning protein